MGPSPYEEVWNSGKTSPIDESWLATITNRLDSISTKFGWVFGAFRRILSRKTQVLDSKNCEMGLLRGKN